MSSEIDVTQITISNARQGTVAELRRLADRIESGELDPVNYAWERITQKVSLDGIMYSYIPTGAESVKITYRIVEKPRGAVEEIDELKSQKRYNAVRRCQDREHARSYCGGAAPAG
jgi:hypothetical protein